MNGLLRRLRSSNGFFSLFFCAGQLFFATFSFGTFHSGSASVFRTSKHPISTKLIDGNGSTIVVDPHYRVFLYRVFFSLNRWSSPFNAPLTFRFFLLFPLFFGFFSVLFFYEYCASFCAFIARLIDGRAASAAVSHVAIDGNGVGVGNNDVIGDERRPTWPFMVPLHLESIERR